MQYPNASNDISFNVPGREEQMSEIDISGLNIEQLNELAAKIKAEEEAAKERSFNEVTELVDTLIAKCDALGIQAKSFFIKKKASEITHRNPENPEEVWKGKGPKPNWLKRAIEGLTDEDAASKIDSYRIA